MSFSLIRNDMTNISECLKPRQRSWLFSTILQTNLALGQRKRETLLNLLKYYKNFNY